MRITFRDVLLVFFGFALGVILMDALAKRQNDQVVSVEQSAGSVDSITIYVDLDTIPPTVDTTQYQEILVTGMMLKGSHLVRDFIPVQMISNAPSVDSAIVLQHCMPHPREKQVAKYCYMQTKAVRVDGVERPVFHRTAFYRRE